MKSKRVRELLDWLSHNTRNIDLPRSFSEDEVVQLVKIAELEQSDPKLAEAEAEKFKDQWRH